MLPVASAAGKVELLLLKYAPKGHPQYNGYEFDNEYARHPQIFYHY